MSEKKQSFREEMRNVNVGDVFDKGTPPAPTQEKPKEENLNDKLNKDEVNFNQ